MTFFSLTKLGVSMTALWSVIASAQVSPTTVPANTVPAQAFSDAQRKLVETQLAALQKKLVEANARCQQLQDENTVLRKRLGDTPTELIELAETGAEPQLLLSGVNGTTITLAPPNGAMTVKETDPLHQVIAIHRQSKGGLGIDAEIPVGKLWLEQGKLQLQWTNKDLSPAAMELLKYATLDLQDSAGRPVKSCSFMAPVAVSVALDQPSSTKLELPASIAAKSKLTLNNPPAGWQLAQQADGTLVLTQAGATVRVKHDTVAGMLSIACSGVGTATPQARLDAANAAYRKAMDEYNTLSRSVVTVAESKRAEAQSRAKLEQIDKLLAAREAAQRDVWDNNQKESPLASLEGTVVTVSLQNGVAAARIILHSTAADAKPSPTRRGY